MSAWSMKLAVLLAALGGGVLAMIWFIERDGDDLEPAVTGEVLDPLSIEATATGSDLDVLAAPPIPPWERQEVLDSPTPETESGVERPDRETTLPAALQQRGGIRQPRREITPDEVFEARYAGKTDEEILEAQDLVRGRWMRAKAKAFDELYEAGRFEVVRERGPEGGLGVWNRANEPLARVRVGHAADGTPEGHVIRIPFDEYPEIYGWMDEWGRLARKAASSERD